MVLDITNAGDAWIVDSEGDVLAVDSARIRLSPASLAQLRERLS